MTVAIGGIREQQAQSIFLSTWNEPMLEAVEIYAKVTNVLAEALVVDKDDITPATALRRDLGADSLDLLEIKFRLEHAFDIEIPRSELFPDSIFRIDPKLVRDGKLTDMGLAEFRSRLPYADLSAYQVDRQMGAVPDFFTVGLVAKYIAWKLGRAGTDAAE
jgi:acyl carrier protein